MEHGADHREGRARGALAQRQEATLLCALESVVVRESEEKQVRALRELWNGEEGSDRHPRRPPGDAGAAQHQDQGVALTAGAVRSGILMGAARFATYRANGARQMFADALAA